MIFIIKNDDLYNLMIESEYFIPIRMDIPLLPTCIWLHPDVVKLRKWKPLSSIIVNREATLQV